MDLDKGVAIVTGGGSGMGRATALRFAAAGTRVVVADVNESAADAVTAEIADAGGTAITCVADISTEDGARDMVARTVAEFGRLDFAANVAGVSQQPMNLHVLPLEDFERDHGVNGRGVFLSMKYQIPAMLDAGAGSIVNVTSGAGIASFAFWSGYSAAKHAAVGLTRAAALEYAHRGIRVNSVSPGAIATPMLMQAPQEIRDGLLNLIPARAFGTAENIAAAIVWMCSDDAAYVTGQVLPVDGAFGVSSLGIVAASPVEEA